MATEPTSHPASLSTIPLSFSWVIGRTEGTPKALHAYLLQTTAWHIQLGHCYFPAMKRKLIKSDFILGF